MRPLALLLALPPGVADPDLAGMPGLPPEPTLPAAPLHEAAPLSTGRMAPDVRFGGAFGTRIDLDLADTGQGEDLAEGRFRLDLELAARLSPAVSTLVSGRLSQSSRTPDGAFDGARSAHEVELREARFSWQAETVGVDLGNLFLRWGTADASSPNDVLNPQDLRDPAPVGFEAPVVPVPAVRLWANPGFLDFELDVIPFFEPHRATLFGTDWAPIGGDAAAAGFAGLVEGLDLIFSEAADDDVQPVLLSPRPPDESPRNVSVATRVGWHGAGIDLHLNATHGWDRIPALRFDPDVLAFIDAARRNDLGAVASLYPRLQPRLEAGEPLLDSRYHRLNLVGADLAWAVDDFLVKAEVAHSFARTLYRPDATPVRTAALSWAGGFDWLPDPDFTGTLECFGLRPFDPGSYLFMGRQLVNLALHLSFAAVTDTLTFDLIAQYGLTQGDHTLAPSVRWQPADGHALAAGVYLLDGPSDTLGGLFADNDAGWMRYVLSF